MRSKSTLLLSTTTTEDVTVVGKPVRAIGFFGPTKGLITFAIRTLNLRGIVRIEGTLSPAPTASDWYLLTPEISFPRHGGFTGETVTLGLSVNTNCLYVRASMDRSGVILPLTTPDKFASFGSVDYVLMN